MNSELMTRNTQSVVVLFLFLFFSLNSIEKFVFIIIRDSFLRLFLRFVSIDRQSYNLNGTTVLLLFLLLLFEKNNCYLKKKEKKNS